MEETTGVLGERLPLILILSMLEDSTHDEMEHVYMIRYIV